MFWLISVIVNVHGSAPYIFILYQCYVKLFFHFSVLPRSAKVELTIKHDEPVLVDEFYIFNIFIENKEDVTICNTRYRYIILLHFTSLLLLLAAQLIFLLNLCGKILMLCSVSFRLTVKEKDATDESG